LGDPDVSEKPVDLPPLAKSRKHGVSF